MEALYCVFDGEVIWLFLSSSPSATEITELPAGSVKGGERDHNIYSLSPAWLFPSDSNTPIHFEAAPILVSYFCYQRNRRNTQGQEETLLVKEARVGQGLYGYIYERYRRKPGTKQRWQEKTSMRGYTSVLYNTEQSL